MQPTLKKLVVLLVMLVVVLATPVLANADSPISDINGLTFVAQPCGGGDTSQVSVDLRWYVNLSDNSSDSASVQVLRAPAGTGTFETIETLPVPAPSSPDTAVYMNYSLVIANNDQFDFKISTNAFTNIQSNTVTVDANFVGNGEEGTGGVVTGDGQNTDNAGQSQTGQSSQLHPSIYTDDQWKIMMFWYTTLASIGGAFLLFAVLRSGYGYIAGGANPGVRASFIEDTQRMVIAVGIIALAPFFVFILSLVNDQFVKLFGSTLNAFAQATTVDMSKINSMGLVIGMFEKILAAPFTAVINVMNFIFGTKSIDELVFNGTTGSLFHGWFSSISVNNNPIASVVLNGSLMGFNVYFNAIYAIRKWILTVNLVATPIIAWVWAISAERQIIEIWVAEIIQTIFMQASQALAFGVLGSIMIYSGMPAGSSTADIVSQLIKLGVFIGGFAGSIGTFIVVFNGLKLIMNTDGEKGRGEALQGIGKGIIGLIIVGLAMSIAGFLAWTLSGDWGTKI